MKTNFQGGWAEYTQTRQRGRIVVHLTGLEIRHPENLPSFMKKIAEDTLCSKVEVGPEVWGKLNALWWHTAGFAPPSSLREGTMVWEPKFVQETMFQ